jgi:hypothetical protein
MSAFLFRFWRFGVTRAYFYLLGTWKHLIWRLWWKQ